MMQRALDMSTNVNLARTGSILVVDDSEENRLAAKTALEDEGYRVTLASGGKEAIAAFETEPPDCIVLDARMPETDGFAVCEHIRALPLGAETPIIFLTALRDIDTFDRALKAGADDFLSKPVRPAELLVRVQSALKLRMMSREFREHYDLLRHQRDALIRVQLQKERLMAFVVHDLKNPVNSMDLHAQVLLRDKTIAPSIRDSATQIRIAARNLTRMILNLLDMSKADEGKLAPILSTLDLPALAHEIVSELEVTGRTRGVKIECRIDVATIAAEEDLLRRLLTNLVENAIRHAPSESVVRVTATADANTTELRIADSGAGVPLDMRDKIFEPFEQIEAKGGNGRGLGLAFCRIAVEALGGRIWLEDAKSGAAFCMSFPNFDRSSAPPSQKP
jgi:two-component system sensor histidine kinase/response regulator